MKKKVADIKGTVVTLGIVLLLTGLNVYFILQNRRLLKTANSTPALNVASVGSRLPVLVGRSPTGTSLMVNTATSNELLVLLFSPLCKYCDQNWPRWDRLLQQQSVKGRVLLVSTAEVPTSYALEHHIVGIPLLTQLNSATKDRFGLNATPQTILVKGGVVIRDWPGPLKPFDLTMIKMIMAREGK